VTIIVAGDTGLAGSAIRKALEGRNESVVGINSSVIDLRNREKTFEFILDYKPTVVIDAAAVVGGISANNSKRVEFLSWNLQIQSNLMDASHKANVERFIFLGSSCIYPRECPQPIKEEYLLTGPLEETNSAYAIAKIAGIELVKSYRKQFQRSWISLMPTNLFGPNDNFNLESAHVLPAMINRFVNAADSRNSSVTLWGNGLHYREFMHSDDFARAVLIALDKYDDDLHLNVGCGKDISIRDLALLVAELTDFQGEILWDLNKPNGTFRKTLNVERLSSLGFRPEISLREGINSTVSWFRQNQSIVRQ
jgi:GDP-L-fucose synthase